MVILCHEINLRRMGGESERERERERKKERKRERENNVHHERKKAFSSRVCKLLLFASQEEHCKYQLRMYGGY